MHSKCVYIIDKRHTKCDPLCFVAQLKFRLFNGQSEFVNTFTVHMFLPILSLFVHKVIFQLIVVEVSLTVDDHPNSFRSKTFNALISVSTLLISAIPNVTHCFVAQLKFRLFNGQSEFVNTFTVHLFSFSTSFLLV